MGIRDFLKIYTALVLFHLAVIYREDYGQMLYLSKPLILISLLVYLISHLKDLPKFWQWLIPALLFSLFGDIALMFAKESAFLIGMGAFALAHLAYIVFYGKLKAKFRPVPLVLALVFAFGSLTLLLQLVQIPAQFQVPIYAYFAFLSLHLCFSVLAFADGKISYWPLIGIGLFIFSDWWIAYSKFGGGVSLFWQDRIMIMSTYAAAQGAILLGLLAKEKP